MATRFGPDSPPETAPKRVDNRSENEGESARFAYSRAEFEKQGEFPDLRSGQGVSKLDPPKKKIYFLQRVFAPLRGVRAPPTSDATSHPLVGAIGSPLVTTFRVRNRCYSTPYGLAARDIFFFIFCATASPSATE